MNKEFDSKREQNHTLVELMGWQGKENMYDSKEAVAKDEQCHMAMQRDRRVE